MAPIWLNLTLTQTPQDFHNYPIDTCFKCSTTYSPSSFRPFEHPEIIFDPPTILKRIKSLAAKPYFSLPYQMRRTKHNSILIGWEVVTSSAPPPSLFKLNTDCNSAHEILLEYTGGLIRNFRGCWIGGFSRSNGFTHSMAAELWDLALAHNLIIRKLHRT